MGDDEALQGLCLLEEPTTAMSYYRMLDQWAKGRRESPPRSAAFRHWQMENPQLYGCLAYAGMRMLTG